PARHRVAVADRAAPAHQDQERRLERILRVVRIAEDPAADVQHDWPVAFHQRGEGGLGPLAPLQEPIQKLAVRPVPDRPYLVERLESLQRNGFPRPAHHRLDPPALSQPCSAGSDLCYSQILPSATDSSDRDRTRVLAHAPGSRQYRLLRGFPGSPL